MQIKLMSWKADFLNWLQQNSPIIYGCLLAVIIAYGRIIYDGVERKNKWVEALLCGALSLAASGGLDYFGMPATVSPLIGGFIGFLGVDKIRHLSISLLNKKTGGSDDTK